MANNISLFNAAVVGENPSTSFILEGDRLHAVELHLAQKREQKHPQDVLPKIKDALQALVDFSQGKVESHFLEIDWDALSDESDPQQYVHAIHNIYTHLPHHDRNELSSLIHHKQSGAKRK